MLTLLLLLEAHHLHLSGSLPTPCKATPPHTLRTRHLPYLAQPLTPKSPTLASLFAALSLNPNPEPSPSLNPRGHEEAVRLLTEGLNPKP